MFVFIEDGTNNFVGGTDNGTDSDTDGTIENFNSNKRYL